MKFIKKVNKLRYKLNVLFLFLTKDKNISYGKRINVRSRFKVNVNGGKLVIGDRVFFNHDCSINCQNKIIIGNDCLFGENVKIYDHNHNFKDLNRPISQQGMKIGTVEIGENCWIGSNTVILMNVKIGENVIIGANSLIYKDIPSNMIVKSNNQINMKKRE